MNVLPGRRSQRGSVSVSYTHLAGAEEQHRAKLRILAAADNQLVTVELDHGLYGDALEMFGAMFGGDSF